MDQTELRYVVSLALIMMFFFRPSSTSTSTVATSTNSTSILTEKPGIEEDCDEVVLIDSPSTPIQTLVHDVTSYINCPANKTTGHCTITFKGRSALLRKSFKLCTSGFLYITRFSGNEVILSSSEETQKYPGFHELDSEVCAPPNEELNVTYKWSKSRWGCLSGIVGDMNIVQLPALGTKSAINLVTSRGCLSYHLYESLYDDSRISIISSYEPEWSEKLNFCEGHISATDSGKFEFCIKFSHFVAYGGGASLQIRTKKKKLMYNYHNHIPKEGQVCIPAQGYTDMYINVVPGKDPQKKFDHAFLLHVTKKSEPVTDVDLDDEDDESIFDGRWFILIVAACLFIGFTCCFYCCCRRKKAGSSPEAPNLQRSDEPTAHPAFQNASRYSATQPPFPQSTIPSVRENNSREQHMMMMREPAAEPDSDKLPSYDSLFPEKI